MKTALKIGLSSLVVAAFFCLAFVTPAPVSAAPLTNCPATLGENDIPGKTCEPINAAQQTQAGANKSGLTDSKSLEEYIAMIINVLLFIIGAVAVVMIIIGGIRYVTSNGDQTQVKGAKDTIMYSVIGLVVAILAFAIVQFVVTNIK